MTAFIILLAVILLIILLLLTNIKLNINSADDLVLRVGAGPFTVKLNNKKRKKLKLRDFTQKKYLKKLESDRAAAEGKTEAAAPKKKNELSDTVDFVTALLSRFEEFTGRLKTEVSHLTVTVAGSNAASAAVTYGVVSQTVTYLLEILDCRTKLRIKDPDKVTVVCDYLAEETGFSLDITLKMRMIDALKTLVKILMLKAQHDGNINNSKENAEREDSSNG